MDDVQTLSNMNNVFIENHGAVIHVDSSGTNINSKASWNTGTTYYILISDTDGAIHEYRRVNGTVTYWRQLFAAMPT